MSRTRSRAIQAVFALISVLAAAAFISRGAAADATTGPGARPGESAATSLRWHVLGLQNGWAAFQHPRAAIQDGVVYLSGSIYHLAGPGTGRRFATLPRALRPSHNLWLPVFTFTGSVGSIEIAATGGLSASGTWATSYTSLAAISFPVKPVQLDALSLRGGWASSQAEFSSGDPAAGIHDGVVYLAGSMHQASGTGNEFALLPMSLRPARRMWLPVYTYNGTTGDIMINTDGTMWVFGAVATAYTSLAGLSFPARSARFRTLSLIHGWVPATAFYGGKPRARLQHGIVYLAGGVQQPSRVDESFAFLPPRFRPAHTIYLPVITAGGAIASLEILSNGRMYAFGGDPTGYTGLAGISFPVTS